MLHRLQPAKVSRHRKSRANCKNTRRRMNRTTRSRPRRCAPQLPHATSKAPAARARKSRLKDAHASTKRRLGVKMINRDSGTASVLHACSSESHPRRTPTVPDASAPVCTTCLRCLPMWTTQSSAVGDYITGLGLWLFLHDRSPWIFFCVAHSPVGCVQRISLCMFCRIRFHLALAIVLPLQRLVAPDAESVQTPNRRQEALITA
jgi:hypothetical protein